MSRLGRDGWIVITLIVLAAALRLPTLGRQSYWYDEVITVDLVHRGLRGLFGGIRADESTPPLYYVVAWFWARVFGTGETGLRLLSALAGIAAVPVAYLCGRVLVSARAGLAAAALAAVSPVLIWYSQEARAYSLFVLLSSLSFLFFLCSRERASKRNLALWSVSSCLALATHYFAVFLVVIEAAWLLALIGLRRRLLVALTAVVATSAVLLPLAADQGRSGTHWIADISLRERVGEALQRLVGPSLSPWWAGVTGERDPPHRWLLAVFVIVIAAVTLTVLGSLRERRAGGLAFAVGAAAFLLPLIASVTGHGDRLLDRNMLATWLPINLAVATGFSASRAGRLGVVGLVALCMASAAAAIAVTARADLQRDDWRSIAGELRGAEAVVIVDPSYDALPLQHYAYKLAALPPRGAAARTITVITPSSRLPSLFRLPHGFIRTDVKEVQRFTLFSFGTRKARIVRRRDLSGTSDEGVFTFLVHRPE